MTELKIALRLQPIVYICRDIERALGLAPTKGYFIITNSSPFAKQTAHERRDCILITDKQTLDTRELLRHPQVMRFLDGLKKPRIVVFKNTKEIQKICAEKGWQLLNPPSELSAQVEEKISQLEWLGSLQKFLPPHKIVIGKNLDWEGTRYIVQFNRAHTGSGTLLIESKKQVQELKNKFPNREMRVTEYILGPALTNNNVVWGTKVLVGNINYQITGLKPFTNRPFATIGNDWALPRMLLNAKQKKEYTTIATEVGKKLASGGWKGLFGIDVLVDETSGKPHLIEINARQPASTTYESELQSRNRTSKNNLTTFETHLAALIGLPTTGYKLQTITSGAQVVQKVTEPRILNLESRSKNLKKLGCDVIPYNNTEPESDLLRIQSKQTIMKAHNQFNEAGNTIAACLYGK